MNDDFFQLASAAIRNHLTAAGVGFEQDDGEFVINGHRLGLSITFDGFTSQGGQIIAPLDIQIHLDGDSGDKFRVGTLGIGRDQRSAMEAAVTEWHLLAAAPVLAALGAAVELRRKLAPVQVHAWTVYPGRVGVRGAMPAELSSGGSFYREIMRALGTVASGWETPSRFLLRSAFVLGTRSPEAQDVQAAVDGFVSEPLQAALAALDWPPGAETYLFKQLFVFRAGSDD
jgi:hypothetical protein